jgi:hypothetical protein
MLFRDKNGNIRQILKYNFINDTLYYRYILENIYNITDNNNDRIKDNNNDENNVMEYIISLMKKC